MCAVPPHATHSPQPINLRTFVPNRAQRHNVCHYTVAQQLCAKEHARGRARDCATDRHHLFSGRWCASVATSNLTLLPSS